MLVLSRKLGESVHIGDEINITVLEIRSNRIRIGIAAPASIRIQRDELWRRLLAGDDDPVVELEALNT